MTTQGAIFNYEEVIDLHTEVGRVSVIGIHTPTGDTPRTLCPGFFQQFKRYKYLGCSVSVVPVATLPADPLSVSYEAGEPTMDPRDLANPMMFHGCHGNDLGNILNRLYSAGLVDSNDLTQILQSDSIDLMNMFNADDDGEPILRLLENLYYRALTDNTWKKAHIQRGFRKSGLRPRIYSLATNMQIQNAYTLGGAYAPGPFEGDFELDPTDPSSAGFKDLTDPTVNPVRYFTPRTVSLGWLDTRQVVPYVPEGEVGDVTLDELDDTIAGLVRGKTIWNELPKIFMGVILMPPAYKTEQYFRVVINHAFAFKGFRGISMSNDMLDMPPNYENWNELLSAGDTDPPEPEPVGSYYQLTDLVASGAPNITIGDVTTPYNTYEELWFAGQFHGTVDATVPSDYSSFTLTTKEFSIPQSVALNPNPDGESIGAHLMYTLNNFKYEVLVYNGVCYSRYYNANNSSWSDWAVTTDASKVPVLSVDGDDLSITSVEVGTTTKYNLVV